MSLQRGQVAIFVVLVFHVFFIFFAMVVNVGLLVFHKINLQNSVDLAAYYAGMKQAEALNVIAHTNYQMRQSWKLLNFRYRAYGIAGNGSDQARLPLVCRTAYSPAQCTQNPPPPSGNENEPFSASCLTSFCPHYPAWTHMNDSENYCIRAGCYADQNITLPGIPQSVNLIGILAPTGIIQAAAAAINLGNLAVAGSRERCEASSMRSWIALASFIYGYKWDMINRKLLIHGLSQGLSRGESDFLDIDGLSVREGALKTLEKNLTTPNLQSLSATPDRFRFTNSLALGGCGNLSGGNRVTPGWLQPIYVRPNFRFLDINCRDNPDSLDPNFYNFTDAFIPPPSSLIPPNMQAVRNLINNDELMQAIQQMATEPTDFNSPEQLLYASTIGFEKNPWCMAYVMVEAETTPKIPFSPLGQVTLKAKAFAKPFGGSIGPWYAKEWPSGQPTSGSFQTPFEMRTDKHLSFRATEGIIAHINNVITNYNGNKANPEFVRELEYLLPSHGRFVGDPGGTKAYNTTKTWLDGIYNLALTNPANKLSTIHWLQILSEGVTQGDILPWDSQSPTPPLSRKLEIEAILPDQFDLSYYSIESNFFDNYAVRLRQNRFLLDGFLAEYGAPEIAVRGDLGYRLNGTWNLQGESFSLDRFSIRDQFSVARNNRFILTQPTTRAHGYPIPGLGYQAKNELFGASLPSTLTSWHISKPGNYTFNPDRFGKCLVSIPQGSGALQSPEIAATPGDCSAGGRSGYSVKLVDPQSLTETQSLGGESTSGRIRNPPPGF